MKTTHNEHDTHSAPDRNTGGIGRPPYWRRAHNDWRFWVMVLLMLLAMLFYVLSDNFALL